MDSRLEFSRVDICPAKPICSYESPRNQDIKKKSENLHVKIVKFGNFYWTRNFESTTKKNRYTCIWRLPRWYYQWVVC